MSDGSWRGPGNGRCRVSRRRAGEPRGGQEGQDRGDFYSGVRSGASAGRGSLRPVRSPIVAEVGGRDAGKDAGAPRASGRRFLRTTPRRRALDERPPAAATRCCAVAGLGVPRRGEEREAGSGWTAGGLGEASGRRSSHRHDGDGTMQTTPALPASARTWLTHAFGCGLEGEDRFTVERYKRDAQRRPARDPARAARGEGPAQGEASGGLPKGGGGAASGTHGNHRLHRAPHPGRMADLGRRVRDVSFSRPPPERLTRRSSGCPTGRRASDPPIPDRRPGARHPDVHHEQGERRHGSSRSRGPANSKDRERYLRRAAARAAAQLCLTCGRVPPASGRKSCEPCLVRPREADRLRHQKGRRVRARSTAAETRRRKDEAPAPPAGSAAADRARNRHLHAVRPQSPRRGQRDVRTLPDLKTGGREGAVHSPARRRFVRADAAAPRRTGDRGARPVRRAGSRAQRPGQEERSGEEAVPVPAR